MLRGANPSQVKGWGRQGPAALGAAKPPAHGAGATRARLGAITAASPLSTPAGSTHLQHRACLHEAFGRAAAGNHLAHHPDPAGAAEGEPCPVLPEGPACFPSQLQPCQLVTPSAPRKHGKECVPQAFQVLPPPPLAGIAFALGPRPPPGSPPPLEKQTCALDAYFRRDFPFQPSNVVSWPCLLLVHLVHNLFIMGKVLPGWLLGTGTGAGGSPSLAGRSPSLQLGTQALPFWDHFALAMGLFSADAGLFPARHTQPAGKYVCLETSPVQHLLGPKLISGLPTTFQMLEMEAQNILWFLYI